MSYEPALGPLDIRSQGLPDWCITGGESGPGARPMNHEWARDVRDQCAALGIAYFLKQYGGYGNNPATKTHGQTTARHLDPPTNGKGGAMLDGRLWREFPVTTQGGK